MKVKNIILAILCVFVFITGGCYKTVDGRVKAGVPFKKDKIEGRYERTVPQVFEASKVVLIRFGKIVSEDTISKSLVGKVDTRTVWIRVTEVDPKVSMVTVQVRTKGGDSDIDLAAQIEKEIALQLVQMR
ncbi:MAG: DUF3568 domain-containing protein [Verrucomicrobiae bacterium]|nr:DUF3568 domain-containing protein [Verrucomicrobiae bacterium]